MEIRLSACAADISAPARTRPRERESIQRAAQSGAITAILNKSQGIDCVWDDVSRFLDGLLGGP